MWKDSFLDYLRFERNYSEATVKGYRNDLVQFEEFVKGMDESLGLLTVDADLIRSWITQLMDEHYASASVNRKLSTLRSFYRFLLKKGEIQVDPVRKLIGPKMGKTLPVFVREKDMDSLLDETDFGEGYVGCRDRMIIEMFYATGMRRAELIGLKNSDVDFSARLVRVHGKRNKQRLIPFGDELKKSLEEYIKVRDESFVDASDYFFLSIKGEKLSGSVVYNLVNKSLSKVAALKKRSPHVLRHTFATTMLNHDAELEAVKELLGHSSLSATEVYTHTTFEELKRIYKQAHPRA